MGMPLAGVSMSRLVLTVLLTLVPGCKVSRTPVTGVASLTADELNLCSFNGRRFLGVMAPDFQNDTGPIQDTFAQFFPSKLIEPSYMVQKFGNDPEKLAACRRRLADMGKYQQVYSNGGTSATKENFVRGLQAMRRAIQSARAADAKAEVQIMLAFSSHGSKNSVDPGGSLVLAGDALVPFTEVADLIYENTMTHDDAATGGQLRLADEVVILMDNCFSGNFVQSIEAYLKRKGLTADQTKVIAISSANYGQVAPGQFTDGKVGVIAHNFGTALRDWVADDNNDGFLTWMEFFDYTRNLAQVSTVGETIKSLTQTTAELVCGPVRPRQAAHRIIRERFDRTFRPLFADPLEALTGGADHLTMTPGGTRPVDPILTPRFYSNVPAEILKNLAFAVTAAGGHRARQDVTNYQAQLESLRTDKERTKELVKVLESAYGRVNGDLAKYLAATGTDTAAGTGGVIRAGDATTPGSAPTGGDQPVDPSGLGGGPVERLRIGSSTTSDAASGREAGAGGTGPTLTLADMALDRTKFEFVYGLITSKCRDVAAGQSRGSVSGTYPNGSGSGSTYDPGSGSGFGSGDPGSVPEGPVQPGGSSGGSGPSFGGDDDSGGGGDPS